MTDALPMGYATRPHPQGEAPQPATCRRCHKPYISVRTAIIRPDGMTDYRCPRCPSCERAHIRGMV